MKILITGGSGFIGRHLGKHLTKLGHEVYTMDNFSESVSDWVLNPWRHFNVDIRSHEEVEYVFKKHKFTHVIHAAAFAAEALSPWMRRYCLEVNGIGTTNIINAAVKYGVEKVIHFSSIAVYGEGSELHNEIPPFKESYTPRPCDVYGATKYYNELDLENAHEFFGLEYSIVRAHNVIGTHQAAHNGYRNAISIFMNQAIKGKPITVYGDGLQERAFSDIKFILNPITKLLTNFHGEVFNLGADEPTTILEAAQTVQKVAASLGFPTNIIHLEPRKEVKIAHCDHSKAKNLLNFVDETNLEETVTEMFKWLLKEPDRNAVDYPYEIDKGIYSFWKK